MISFNKVGRGTMQRLNFSGHQQIASASRSVVEYWSSVLDSNLDLQQHVFSPVEVFYLRTLAIRVRLAFAERIKGREGLGK